MADGETRKKFAILGVSSVILVAMIVAVTLGTRNATPDNYSHEQEASSSQKAVETICAPTDYKATCIDNLKSVDSSNPKDLIGAAFKATVNYLNDAANNSTVLHQLETDPKAKLALENCKELAQNAIADLEKSFNTLENFDFNTIDELFDDIQVWLSGAITHQETCLDGFEGVSGDAVEKMRKALNISMELSSDGLAMMNDISSIFSELEIPSSLLSRRLLSDDVPDWVDGRRKLLPKNNILSVTKPDLIVAKDGTGNYTTINEALMNIPKKSKKIFVLYIKEGIYEEKVTFEKDLTHLMVIGDGPTKTRITGRLNFIDGTPTYHTATVVVAGDFFIAKDIGFENAAGADKHQAVALRVSADKVIFYNCHMDGYQDTLYAHTYRQYYRDCKISGTIDFIFGDSAAVFQNCTLEVRKPLDNQQCIVTAQGRKDIRQPTGLLLHNCSFVAAPEYFPHRFQLKSYLGRPWKEFSRTLIIESFIDDLIQPEGWLPWMDDFALETLFYTEFNNRGPASEKNLRVQWPGVKELPASRIARFLPQKFIEGNSWVPKTGVPYSPGFIYPPPKKDKYIKYSDVDPQEYKDLAKHKDKEAYKATPEAPKSNSGSNSIFLSPVGAPEASPGGMPPMASYSPNPAPPTSTSKSSSAFSWITHFW